MSSVLCPCGSGQRYEACCQPFHTKSLIPKTAEQLMRSRYSAFVKVLPDYLLDTHHVSTRKKVSKADLVSWAKATTWLRLEILGTQFGSTEDVVGMVEFKAYIIENGQPAVHHEKSTFRKEAGFWFYVDGQY